MLEPSVTQVTTVVRKASARADGKVREFVHGDLLQLAGLNLACDLCIFAVGVSSAGLSEEAYSKVTYEMALTAAKAVLSPRRRPERAVMPSPALAVVEVMAVTP